MDSSITFLPFTLNLLWWVLLLLVFLFISASVSGSEGAFFSLTPNEVEKLKKNNSSSSSAALRLLSMQDYLLATILIANNMVNIGAILVANRIIDLMVVFHSGVLEFIVKTIIVTFLLLLFGEIMPKILATTYPLAFVRRVSKPLLALKHFFKPLSYLLINSSSHINDAVAKRKNISMDEISDALELAQPQNAEDRKMLKGIVNYINTEVTDIMRPRVDVVAISCDASFDEVKHVIVKSGFSRIPVYQDDLDEVKGILYVKDLIPFLANEDFQWQNILRQPYVVPEHKRINDLLEEFQVNKIHFALVVDEYGSVQGVVSMEDILEEIVGEISDESDSAEESYYTRLGPNSYLFEAKIHLNDFLKVVGLEDDYLDDSRGEAETLAGYMLEIKRDFLKADDVVKNGIFTMQVVSMEGRRIKKVKVTVNQQ